MLLRRLGLRRTHQAIVLSLVLTCPLYIFYSRAFLIETMALMFGGWYLAALHESVARRSVALAGRGRARGHRRRPGQGHDLHRLPQCRLWLVRGVAVGRAAAPPAAGTPVP